MQKILNDPKFKKFGLVTIIVAVLFGAIINQTIQYEKSKDREGLVTVKIDSGAEQSELFLELADEPHEHIQGLMFKKEIAEDGGMLFIFPNEQYRSFWMKNTFVSLDIIFVDANQRIVNIAKRTAPLDTSISYKSAAPAKYVIEVNAGYSDAHGIEPGDLVVFGE